MIFFFVNLTQKLPEMTPKRATLINLMIPDILDESRNIQIGWLINEQHFDLDYLYLNNVTNSGDIRKFVLKDIHKFVLKDLR